MPWKTFFYCQLYSLHGFYVEGYPHSKNGSALCLTHSSRNYVYIFIELTNWREMLSNRYVCFTFYFPLFHTLTYNLHVQRVVQAFYLSFQLLNHYRIQSKWKTYLHSLTTASLIFKCTIYTSVIVILSHKNVPF